MECLIKVLTEAWSLADIRLLYCPHMLIPDYCHAGCRGFDSVPMALPWSLPQFDISTCELVEDSEDTLIRHTADMWLSGMANVTDDRLKDHGADPPRTGIRG